MCCQVTHYVIKFCTLSFMFVYVYAYMSTCATRARTQTRPWLSMVTWSMRNSKLHTSRPMLIITSGASLLMSELKQYCIPQQQLLQWRWWRCGWATYCLSLAIASQLFSTDGRHPATSLAGARSWCSLGPIGTMVSWSVSVSAQCASVIQCSSVGCTVPY